MLFTNQSSDPAAPSWWVYILHCADGTYYTGATNNLDLRLLKHNQGLGAKYTKTRVPVSMVYAEPCLNRSEALKREFSIKKLTRDQKSALISGNKSKSSLN